MVIRRERSRKLQIVSLEFIRNIIYAAIFPTIVIGLLLIKMPEDALVPPYSIGKLPIIARIVAMGAFFGVLAALAFVAVTTIREQSKTSSSRSYMEPLDNEKPNSQK
jgi:hypothetical protein